MPAFIFDLDDTLYNQLVPFQRAFEHNFGQQAIPVEKLFKYSRKYSDQVFEETEKGQMSLMDMQIYRITQALQRFNKVITPEQSKKFQLDYQFFQGQIQLYPVMEKVFLHCLKSDLKLGLITNGPEKHQKQKIKVLQLTKWIPPQCIFISGELGLAKPDIRLFEYVEHAIKTNKEQIYYIGDSFENDIKGSNAAGWKNIWLNYRNQKTNQQEITPNHTITTTAELYPLIKKLV